MSGPRTAGLSVLVPPVEASLGACFVKRPQMSPGGSAHQLTAEQILVSLINPVISGNRDISCDLYLLVKSPLTSGAADRTDRKQENARNLQERQ